MSTDNRDNHSAGNSSHNPYGQGDGLGNGQGLGRDFGQRKGYGDSSSSARVSTAKTTLKDMWKTRPVRIPDDQGSDAWLCGVAEGIAVRYDVSVVLIRLLFVMLTSAGGVGPVVYAALVLFLPRYTVPVSPAEALMSRDKDPRLEHDRTVGWIAGIITFLLTIDLVASLGTEELVGIACAIGLAALLYYRAPEPPAGFYATAAGSEPTAREVASEEKRYYTSAPGWETAATPPSWDPLGTAPFAWHLPEPPENVDTATLPKKRRGPLRVVLATGVIIVMVFTLITGGFVAYDLVRNDSDSSRAVVLGVTEQTADNHSAQQSFRWYLSDGTLRLDNINSEGALGSVGNTTVDVRATLSSVEVVVPATTTGTTYTVTIDDRNTVASTIEPPSGTVLTVRGRTPEPDAQNGLTNGQDRQDRRGEPTPNVTLHVDMTLSSLRITQR